MKKIFSLLAIITLSISVFAQSTTPRYGITKSRDNTGRVLTYNFVATNDDAGNDTISTTPNAWETIIRPSSNLTDSVNIKCPLTNCYVGDYLTVIVTKGSTNGAVRFPSAYFITSTSTQRCTITANKTAIFRFQFNGVKFIEISRLVQP